MLCLPILALLTKTMAITNIGITASNYPFFFCFLGPHPWHMEVPLLEVQSELQLPTYTTATPDPSHVCDLHNSSWQRRILKPLSKARDQTCNLTVPRRICFLCATTGTPTKFFKLNFSTRKHKVMIQSEKCIATFLWYFTNDSDSPTETCSHQCPPRPWISFNTQFWLSLGLPP